MTSDRDHLNGRMIARPVDAVSHPVDITSLAAIRDVVARAARLGGLASNSVNDLVLAANELATNVVRHGGGRGTMWIWATTDCVFCRMSDYGPGMQGSRPALEPPSNFGPPSTYEPPEPGSLTGRGLWMVHRMTDHMDIATGPGGTTVTIAISIPQ